MDGLRLQTPTPSPVDGRLRVLVLARNYPNSVFPLLGLWTQRLVQCVTGFAEVKVVAPVPYAPPLPGIGALGRYARYRQVEDRRMDGPVEVLHPRMLVGPGYSLHNLEGLSYWLAVRPTVGRVRRRFPFDVIHAHFTYPDGFAACLLGRRFGVRVVITEHAPWLPWMATYPRVRQQAVWAARACDAHMVVSEYARKSIAHFVGSSPKLRVVHNVVDTGMFRPGEDDRVRGQILFVGAVRHVKGVDVLFHALQLLRQEHPEVRLVLVGAAFFESYRREAERLVDLAQKLGIDEWIEWAGSKAPSEVAQMMAQSSVVVLPSRAEAFPAVLIEALACGTPVVATRCGGPEEVVTSAVGQLVPTEDPIALAEALASVIEHGDAYDPATLRAYALDRYSMPVIAEQIRTAYEFTTD